MKKNREGDWVPVDPPARLIKDLLSLPAFPSGIPVLDQIKSTPLLTEDGELIATSGLHPEHRVYLALAPGLEGMTLPEKITEQDIENAVAVIVDPFVDFPFDEPSSANVIGMLYTMVFRECVDGLTPLFALDANRASAGKGTLAGVLSAIAYGCDATFSSGNVGSEELRKRLFALASQGARFHVLDNVERIVWSPELSAFLTASNWEDRKLGASETYSFPNRMVIALTGNHVRIGGDIARRTVLISLRTDALDPSATAAYTHEPIIPYVLSRRTDILRAMYTVVAAWHRNGRKIPADTPRMGSFQEWANFSAGILHTMGEYTGLLGNREEVKGRDSDAAEYTLMLVRARQHFGGATFRAKDLWAALALEDVPHCITAGTERSVGASPLRRMGRLLMRLEGQPFGEEGLTVRTAGVKDHAGLYRVETRAERDAIHRNLKSTE